MIEYNRKSWWKNTFSWHGTAVRIAGRRILIIIVYALLVQAIYEGAVDFGLFDDKHFLQLDPLGHTFVGSLVGFLIVFRMNASNARYWEGRSHWGMIINTSRNLVRVGCEQTDGGEELAGLVTGYVICLRRSLQGQRDMLEADVYLSGDVCREAIRFGNPPTGVAAAISEWIHRYRRNGQLEPQMVRHMEQLLSLLVDAQGGCEKIQKTPMPFAYVVMLKQIILAYLLTLPLVLCERCGWWTPLLVGIVSLGLLGMEEASVEIEDPFGTEENCLNLEALTLTIARDTGQLADFAERRRRAALAIPQPVVAQAAIPQ
jgi:putative membrane protein